MRLNGTIITPEGIRTRPYVCIASYASDSEIIRKVKASLWTRQRLFREYSYVRKVQRYRARGNDDIVEQDYHELAFWISLTPPSISAPVDWICHAMGADLAQDPA